MYTTLIGAFVGLTNVWAGKATWLALAVAPVTEPAFTVHVYSVPDGKVLPLPFAGATVIVDPVHNVC